MSALRIALAGLTVSVAAGFILVGVEIGKENQARVDAQQDTYSQVGWCMKRDRIQ